MLAYIAGRTAGPNWLTFLREPNTPGVTWAKQTQYPGGNMG